MATNPAALEHHAECPVRYGDTLANCECADYRPARRVGERVTHAGFPGTITRVCEWAPTMVEVRLASGTVCVTMSDLRPLRENR